LIFSFIDVKYHEINQSGTSEQLVDSGGWQRCSWGYQIMHSWSGKDSSSRPEMAKLEQTGSF